MTTPREISIVARILDEYHIHYTQILDGQKGYRNRTYPVALVGGGMANLILYKPEPGILTRIRHANFVSDYLAERGFPTRRTYESKIICLQSLSRTRYGSVYNYLPGHTIEWSMYSMKYIKVLGLALGRIHAALRELRPPSTFPSATTEYSAIVGRMHAYFSHPEVQAAMQAKLGLSLEPSLFQQHQRLLSYCATLPDQQILHMDFVRSNILFTPTQPGAHDLQVSTAAITGVLDFEKTSFGHPVLDLARTLAFLLVDVKTKPEAKIRQYFLLSGYIKRGGGVLTRAALLEPLINLFLVHDFYKFLRHNPYDHLHTNEHYVRTATLLQQRGLVGAKDPAVRIPARNFAR